MKLLIVDDNAQFRNRLASILGTLEGVEVIGKAKDVPDALEILEN